MVEIFGEEEQLGADAILPEEEMQEQPIDLISEGMPENEAPTEVIYDSINEEGQDVIGIDESTQNEEESLTAILNHVLDNFEVAARGRDEGGREADWDKHFQMYMCQLDISNHPWRSKVFDPESFAVIETVHPRIVNTVLGGPEIFGVKPTGQDDVEKSRKSKSLLDYDADRMDLFAHGGDVNKDGLIFGTGHGKVRWRREKESRYVDKPVTDPQTGQQVIDPETGQPMTEKVKDFPVVYNGPWMDRIDNGDAYPDPNALTIPECRFFIHRVMRDRNYLKLKEQSGSYFNIDKIPKSNARHGNRNSGDNRKQMAKVPTDDSVSYVDDEQNPDRIELLEYWGQYDIDDDGLLEEVVITVANGATVIRAEPNPFPGGFKPFIKYCPIPIPGSYWGMSLLTPIEGLQDALNDRTNQIADNISLILNKGYKISKYGEIDQDDLVSAPGMIVPMADMGDLEPIDTPDIVGSVFGEVNRLEGKVQKAVGTYDYAVGGSPQRQEAATTVISLQQVAEIRFKTILMNFERQFIRPLGNMMLKMYKAGFMGPEREIRILGIQDSMGPQEAEFATVSAEDIAHDPDIYAMGAMMNVGMSKAHQLDGVMKLLTIISGNPQLMMHPTISYDISVLIEELPYLLDLRLKRPIVVQGNPMMELQRQQQQQQLSDQLMMSMAQTEQQAGLQAAAGNQQMQMQAAQREADVKKEAKNRPQRKQGGTRGRKGGSR